jgi:cobalt-precorrin-5B (C1)-methyltransferase
MSKLKKGYTTGVHTSFAFKSALGIFLADKTFTITKTVKNDNDDLDVTKGCQIVVNISLKIEDININKIKHQPYCITNNSNKIFIYAGDGVGVVTKDGLKPPKNYPAINPTPLKAIENIFKTFTNDISNTTIYCSIGVSNGEQIAKQTANSKVGVLGGISILGTTGWVKPISATAYINSIEAELDFAIANSYKTIVFTLGNTAFAKAKTKNDNIYIIEIGNFIYDAIQLAIKKGFDHIELWLGIAKSVKIAQGFKNTHNRFGSIDFDIVQNWCDIDIKDCLTIKAVRELLKDDVKNFDKIVINKTKDQLKSWFDKDIEVIIC